VVRGRGVQCRDRGIPDEAVAQEDMPRKPGTEHPENELRSRSGKANKTPKSTAPPSVAAPLGRSSSRNPNESNARRAVHAVANRTRGSLLLLRATADPAARTGNRKKEVARRTGLEAALARPAQPRTSAEAILAIQQCEREGTVRGPKANDNPEDGSSLRARGVRPSPSQNRRGRSSCRGETVKLEDSTARVAPESRKPERRFFFGELHGPSR
jgi:hypothetical protein